jgi:uncharacterized membrane protein
MNATSTTVLLLAVFGASAVEMVEGAAAALIVLSVIVGAVGVPLIHYVPINGLRVAVGALLLVVGLTWLRKAILRASGLKAMHDEDAIFAATSSELKDGAPSMSSPTRRDRVGFAVAFKGVFLEGTEVVLIVVGLGASQHRLGIAAGAAAAAAVVVAAVGAAVAKQLSKVPENSIKLTVGVMLTSFGLFWVGEGAGEHWPGADLAILALVGLFSLVTLLLVMLLRTRPTAAPEPVDVFARGAAE